MGWPKDKVRRRTQASVADQLLIKPDGFVTKKATTQRSISSGTISLMYIYLLRVIILCWVGEDLTKIAEKW